ncbi:hypothetical protein BASA82_000682 [Batrachochytrium salamandrivorans]|nr:hypothetical protein BASA81_004072 [Batrachochytrium salamandrivorans]KAH9262271.1 hypothetical protein BASA82_000682 [Batrachochytrium salamandrivorans]
MRNATLLLLAVHATRASQRIAGDGSHFIVRQANGQVYATGGNEFGQLGINSSATQCYEPRVMLGVSNATDVAAGEYHSCIVDLGQAWCTGQGTSGQLGESNTNSPWLVPVPGMVAVVEVFAAIEASCARLTSGEIKCWGNYPAFDVGTRVVTHLALGRRHACVLLAGDGKVYCQGNNLQGQLGIGAADYSSGLTAVVGLEDVVSVACGRAHTCAVTGSDGAVYCWGENTARQVDNSMNMELYLPVRVLTAGAAWVSAGWHSSFAVMHNGTALMLGKLDAIGPTTLRVLAYNVLELCAGEDAACVRLRNGSVQCVGSNSLGQLGVGNGTESSLKLVAMLLPSFTRQPTTLAPTMVVVTAGPTKEEPFPMDLVVGSVLGVLLFVVAYCAVATVVSSRLRIKQPITGLDEPKTSHKRMREWLRGADTSSSVRVMSSA